jgi:hypothetical protein
MAYNSKSTEEPGQYPTNAWHLFGLPEQSFGSGAPGASPPSDVIDEGGTNQPGQYPDRGDFTGVPLGGSGAPGTQGITAPDTGGGQSVTFDEPTFYKGEHTSGNFDDDGAGNGKGYKQTTIGATVSGRGDWTQANSQGYQADAQYQMPGVAGNTPAPGDGRHQTDGEDGSPHVLYGGWLKGQRPGTSRHPGFSGPGS